MRKVIAVSIFAYLVISGCTDNHFISDRAYRKKVEAQYEKQKELAKNRSKQLFSVFDQKISTSEKEALQFLYAYSSLNDLADYNGDFFLKNIRASFAARDTFSWGKKIPENIFRHFVLPVRVNNENLDSSRWVFFNDLKDRIKSLPMKEAALEVNHWCHEKVTYRGSDGRTSSPLASVKTAFGRCGEESTFTVAALRAVGIPARQCYTPRWAHCDDNHAWVEVWVDGKWRFIGACEPDADLDLAWFTKPAKRAMLVNTTVFGDYEGPEDVLQKDPLFTRINVLENYAPIKKVTVSVVDLSGKPCDSAQVEFQLYNYAEFYPLFKTVTGKDGKCSFTTGQGELLVWAAGKGKYGFAKLDVRKYDTVKIILHRNESASVVMDIDLVPPVEREITAEVSDSARKKNSDRLTFEDKLRSAYEATFIDSSKSARLATLLNLNPDTLWTFLHKSRGNWREITEFITSTTSGSKHLIFPLLENISEKDLRDIEPDALEDVISSTSKYQALTSNTAEFNKYILSPRVDNEWLKPCRNFFQSAFDAAFIDSARNSPDIIAGWIRKNVVLNNTGNYSRAPITPTGVFELRVADEHSAAICFVSICRSFGIPARLDPATKAPQYLFNGTWKEARLHESKKQDVKKGMLTLVNFPENEKKPEYSTHYTIESYEDGFFRTLDYEGSPLVQDFPCAIEVSAGPSLMVTGVRLTNGTVLAKLKFFTVKSGETTNQSIELRKNKLPTEEYGRISEDLPGKKATEGMIVAWVDPDKEPTKHLLSDLRQKKKEFGAWKGSFMMVFPSEEQMKTFVKKEAGSLPPLINYSFQSSFPIRISDIKAKTVDIKNLPVVIFINREGVIIYLSEGYRIGTGDELLTLMK